VDLFYKFFIPVVLGGMGLLVVMDLGRKIINRYHKPAPPARPEEPTPVPPPPGEPPDPSVSEPTEPSEQEAHHD